jgi:hypothetical protein
MTSATRDPGRRRPGLRFLCISAAWYLLVNGPQLPGLVSGVAWLGGQTLGWWCCRPGNRRDAVHRILVSSVVLAWALLAFVLLPAPWGGARW